MSTSIAAPKRSKQPKPLGGKKCHCGWNDCRELMIEHESDPNAPRINGTQMFVKIARPEKIKAGRKKKLAVFKEQIFTRVCSLCNIQPDEAPSTIRIGIVHFHHEVIDAFNASGSNCAFLDFLLDQELIKKLPVVFTDIDKLVCIGTGHEEEKCKSTGKCKCKKYLNVPFVSQGNVAAKNWSCPRTMRAGQYSEKREVAVAPAVAQVQQNRAEKADSNAVELKRMLEEAQKKIANTEAKRKRDIEAIGKAHENELKRAEASVADERRKRKAAEKAESRWKAKAKEEHRATDGDTSNWHDIKQHGLSRVTLLNPAFHENHPKAARDLFGFESLSEFLIYADVLFPDVGPDIEVLLKNGPAAIYNQVHLTNLEKCLLAKMAITTGLKYQRLCYIFGLKSKGHLSDIVSVWDPRWGWAGKLMSYLDVNESYLQRELPDEYEVNDLGNVGTQCDGKDYACETFRKSSALNRLVQSSKVKRSALRDITWSTATGLVWYYSPLVLSRSTENAIVQWCGECNSEDGKWIPIRRSDWNDNDDDAGADGDAAGTDGNGDEAEASSAVGATESHYSNPVLSDSSDDEVERRLGDAGDEDVAVVAVLPSGDDAEELAAEGYGPWTEALEIADEGYSESDSDDSDDDSALDIFGQADKFFSKYLDDDGDDEEPDKKKARLVDKTALTAEEIEVEAAKVRDEGPDENGRTKLEQLETLESLHKMCEGKIDGKSLRKCLLSMHLKMTECDRRKTIKELKEFRDGLRDDPPKIPKRLAKLPQYLAVLADRGFASDSLSCPNFNKIISPAFLEGREQFEMDEVRRDRKKCELRYTCEVVYSRVVNEDILKGVIPYEVLNRISNAHSWAHGACNLYRPLKIPGSNCGLNADYFD